MQQNLKNTLYMQQNLKNIGLNFWFI